MHWHLQWQKLTHILTTNTMVRTQQHSQEACKAERKDGMFTALTVVDLFKRFLNYKSLVRTIVKKRKSPLWSSSHSNRITSEQSNPNYVTTFHVQPTEVITIARARAAPRLFCLKWRPVTRKRDVRDQRRKWSNTSRKEWTGFRVDTRHSTRRHLLLYNCTKVIKLNINPIQK